MALDPSQTLVVVKMRRRYVAVGAPTSGPPLEGTRANPNLCDASSDNRQPMPAELTRRVEKVVGYPPLSEMAPRSKRQISGAMRRKARSGRNAIFGGPSVCSQGLCGTNCVGFYVRRKPQGPASHA